jgi:hypothetical protein
MVPARNEDFLEIVVRRGQRTLGCCPIETFLESLLLEDFHLLQMEQRQLKLPVYNNNQGVRYNKRLNKLYQQVRTSSRSLAMPPLLL